MAKQETPQANVSARATSNRPYLSLRTPMQGLPIAVPRLSNALTVAACPDERPRERAKSGSEYNNTIYPNMEMKAHESRSCTSVRRTSFKSNPRWYGRMASLRFLITTVAMSNIEQLINAVTRKDQAKDTFWMTASVKNEKMRPPMPEPAALIPFAKLRRFWNHWDMMAMLGT